MVIVYEPGVRCWVQIHNLSHSTIIFHEDTKMISFLTGLFASTFIPLYFFLKYFLWETQKQAEAEGQEAERVRRPEARCPCTIRSFWRPRCPVHSFRGDSRAHALLCPTRHPVSHQSWKWTCLSALSPRPAVPGGVLVVGEWVPQEDEDKDDAGRCQGRAGDVEQPGCLGIFHRSIQVVEKLLVPNLQPEGGGEASGQREGNA